MLYDTQVMHVWYAAHDWRFRGNYSNGLLSRLTFANLFFEVGEGLHEEERRYNWQIEVVEKNGFIDAEALKGGLIKNYDWPSRH